MPDEPPPADAPCTLKWELPIVANLSRPARNLVPLPAEGGAGASPAYGGHPAPGAAGGGGRLARRAGAAGAVLWSLGWVRECGAVGGGARVNVEDLRGATIAFCASGGLDSCTITHWLTQHDVRVVSYTADLGQTDETDLGEVAERMRACGAVEAVVVPLRTEMGGAGLAPVPAQARYAGGYWNTPPLARSVTVRGILPLVRRPGHQPLSSGAAAAAAIRAATSATAARISGPPSTRKPTGIAASHSAAYIAGLLVVPVSTHRSPSVLARRPIGGLT